MKTRTMEFFGVFFILLGSIASAQNHPFDWPSSYTIEYIQKFPGDPTKNTYSVRCPNKFRRETTNLKINSTSVSIFDLDKQNMVSFMPSTGVYKETSIKGIKNMKLQHMFDTNGLWEKLSVEKINGIDAVKYKCTTGKSNRCLFIWLSEKAGEPLKMTNDNGTWLIEVKKYVSGPVDDSLFRVPSGFQSFDDLPHSFHSGKNI